MFAVLNPHLEPTLLSRICIVLILRGTHQQSETRSLQW